MLKQFVLSILSFIFFLSVAFANGGEQSPIDKSNNSENSNNSNIVVAPVIIDGKKINKNSNSSEDALIGALIAEYKQGDPNALNIIRAELKKMMDASQNKAKADGVLLSTVYRFSPETLTFFAAIGLVTAGSMWTKSEGDPLAMERHILSLKDPIAHISFFAFMLTNGFYIDFRTHGAGFLKSNPDLQRRMMRRFNYQGMALGSLASSIVADLGHSGKMCIDKWIKGKDDEQSVQTCNDAWKSWTARNKFTQYFPQIISMWASQAAADLLDGGVRKGFTWANTTRLAKNLLSKEWLVEHAYKVTGADVALTFVGGTLAMKGIKWVGHLTKFTLFVGIDHFLVSPFIYRPLNNLIRPLFFDFDAFEIDKLWKVYDDADWDESKLVLPQKPCSTALSAIPYVSLAYSLLNKKNCQNSLETEIENYGVQTQQWREHLNSDVEADLAGWMEMTKELLNQIDYSYKFYKSFAKNLFTTLNTKYRVEQNPNLGELINRKSNFPFRTLPLYGISMGEAKTMGGSSEDLYLNSPIEIEQRQREHIKNILNSANLITTRSGLKGQGLEKFNSIIQKLLSDSTSIIAAGLNELNIILRITSIDNENRQHHWYAGTPLIETLTKIRNKLGNPFPIVYPLAGFTQAFTVNTIYKLTVDAADFSLWSSDKKYKFSKASDLMLYKLMCGNYTASFDKTKVPLTSLNALSPQFDPPTLLKNTEERKKFCDTSNQWRTTKNMYASTTSDKNLESFILENFNYDAIGDYRDKNFPQYFDSWWTAVNESTIQKEFTDYDNQFKAIITKAHNNIFDQRSFYKWSVDHLNQSSYLQKSLMAQLKTETELYLQLIQRALTPAGSKLLKKPAGGFTNYLKATVASSKEDNFNALYGPTYKEVQKVSELINSYYLFILPEKVDFNGYIGHSKKIDTAINKLLVAAGLKVLEQENDDLFEGKAASSGTESTESIFKDVPLQKHSLRQKVIIASVKGLRQVEGEVRRLIRMKIMLGKGLEVESAEFQAELEKLPGQKLFPQKKGANPRGN